MTTPTVGLERRVGQRFPYLLPLSLHQAATSLEALGVTQDLSSRGVFFFTDAAVTEGAEIEITLRMPSEITLGESMLVRCRGRVLRVRPSALSPADSSGKAKVGVAVRLEGYEYLPNRRNLSLLSLEFQLFTPTARKDSRWLNPLLVRFWARALLFALEIAPATRANPGGGLKIIFSLPCQKYLFNFAILAYNNSH